MPADYPDFPSHWQAQQYLRAYARHFGIVERTRFQVSVEQVSREADGAWLVRLHTGERYRYGGVVIANGHNWSPRRVSYPGEFSGTLIHSADYRTSEVLRGRRVVVVGGPDAPRSLSLRTVPWVEADAGLQAVLALLRATSVRDVEAALAGWVEPVNAVLTADRSGAVVELTAGKVPRRHPDNREGPVEAWSGAHQWDGWESHRSAPVPQYAVHANQPTAQTRPFGRDFAAPHRAERIAALGAPGEEDNLPTGTCAA